MADDEGPLFPAPEDGIAKIERLPRWSSTLKENGAEQAPEESTGAQVKFTFDPSINKKIIFWDGDVTKINTDAIINSTNEGLNEKNGLSERILELGGEELIKEVAFLEGCRTGEAKITTAFGLPCRYVIHTVGPRYNLKYKTAAESALHNCYRSSLELVKEYELSSIAFTVINSSRRGYPPEAGTHLALRTIRRFLERYGKGIDTIVLVVTDEADKKAYESLLPLYFPRSQAEAVTAITILPDDIGNEMGEPVQEERKIRIRDIPGFSARMNVPVVSEDNPLRNWADPNREAEEIVPSFAKMQGDHDTIRREELITKAVSRGEQNDQKYLRLLRRARNENLSDMAAKNLIYQSGVDSMGRPIICVNGKYYNPDDLDKDRVLMYLVHYLDSVASKDYVVVYFNAEATSDNHPEISFVREVYGVLHPKYRRNLRLFYLVHPTWWVKLTVTLMNTFFTSDIREKMRNVETLSQLYESIPPQQLVVPDYVAAYDRMVVGGGGVSVKSSSQNHHEDL